MEFCVVHLSPRYVGKQQHQHKQKNALLKPALNKMPGKGSQNSIDAESGNLKIQNNKWHYMYHPTNPEFESWWDIEIFSALFHFTCLELKVSSNKFDAESNNNVGSVLCPITLTVCIWTGEFLMMPPVTQCSESVEWEWTSNSPNVTNTVCKTRNKSARRWGNIWRHKMIIAPKSVKDILPVNPVWCCSRHQRDNIPWQSLPLINRSQLD